MPTAAPLPWQKLTPELARHEQVLARLEDLARQLAALRATPASVQP